MSMSEVRLSDRDLEALAERVAIKLVGALRPSEPDTSAAPELVTKAEVAHALRRSTPTVDRWVTEGMPFVDMGSYRLYDLAACREWVAARPKPGRPVRREQPNIIATSPIVGVERRTRARRA